jgi:hypothetical protein
MGMTVGLCRVWLRLPQNHSLKETRQRITSLVARLHNKFNVAVAEVGRLPDRPSNLRVA